MAIAATVLFGAVASPLALASRDTTSPSSTLLVEVVVSKKNVIIGVYADTMTHDGMIPFGGGKIPRGDFLDVQLVNKGSGPAQFTAFGKKTPVVKPGRTGHFSAVALRRGRFAYSVSFNDGKRQHGVFIVT